MSPAAEQKRGKRSRRKKTNHKQKRRHSIFELALGLRNVEWYHSFPCRVGLSLPVSVLCIGLESSLVTHRKGDTALVHTQERKI